MISGAVAAAIVVVVARRTRSLSRSGAVCGAVAGTISVAAAWSRGILLLLFFVTSSILSRFGQARKIALTGDVGEKGGKRDMWQVLANGGVYFVAALASLSVPSAVWYSIGAGALASATADTWATEIGTYAGGVPVSIVSGRRVPPGTSGGISIFGSLAGVAGALFIAVSVALAKWPVPVTATLLGGIVGALSDSILGATLQARRRCDACGKSTERLVHDCGAETVYGGGLAWLDNDVVNFLSTAFGALVTLLAS
jgi:uncharacterized protein (TIGR00297 family)